MFSLIALGAEVLYCVRICAVFKYFGNEIEAAVIGCGDDGFDGLVLLVF